MKKKRLIGIAVVLVVVLLAAVWLWRETRADQSSELAASGTVEATEARLGFQSPGRVAAIQVREGQRVSAGAILAELDATELQARRRQAQARVDAAEAVLKELERGFQREEIAQAEAAVKAARERLRDLQRDLERNRKLYEGGAISLEAYQKSATAVEVAESQLTQTIEQVALLRKGARPEKIEAQRAQVAEARAGVRAVDAALQNTTIQAPMDGVVTVRHAEPNEIVASGQPVVTVMNPADRWVRIYVPENRIGALRLGGSASIYSDTYPNKRYPGRIIYISPEAEFTPKSVQTAEERVRLVYAVKVRIDADPELELKPGMPVDVTLDTRSEAEIRG